TSSTSFGGEGFIVYVYYFILITHIILAMATIPLVLTSVTRAWNVENVRHKKVARWTMPLWKYVSLTVIIVYFLIRSYSEIKVPAYELSRKVFEFKTVKLLYFYHVVYQRFLYLLRHQLRYKLFRYCLVLSR